MSCFPLSRITSHRSSRVHGSINFAPLRLVVSALLPIVLLFTASVVIPATTAGAATTLQTQVVGGGNNPSSAVVDAAGNLFFTDSGGNSVIVVAKTTGTIFGQSVSANVPVKLAAATGLGYPNDLVFDTQGNLYVSNFNSGTISVIPAHSGTLFGQPVTINDAATLNAASGITNPIAIAFDGAGNMFVTNSGHVTVIPTVTSTIFGQQFTANIAASLNATSSINAAFGLVFDVAGNLYVALSSAVAVVPVRSGTLFGQSVTADTPTTLTSANSPTGLAIDTAGDLFYASGGGVSVIPAATGTLFGQPVTVNTPTGTPATGLNNPQELSFDASGNLYVGNFNAMVVTVLPVTGGTLFGQSVSADTPSALSVSNEVNQPQGMAFDSAGDLFIANYGDSSVTVIAKNSGTLFGQSVSAGATVHLAAATGISGPHTLAFDTAGDLFIANSGHITVIAKNSGVIFGQTFTANVAATLTVANGVDQPYGIAFDSLGDLFITNLDNFITVIPASTTTIFGQSVVANTQAGLTLTDGMFNQPGAIAFDGQGDLFVTNASTSGLKSNTVSVVIAASGTLFGQSVTANSVITLSAATGLSSPTGLAFDAAGNLFIANRTANGTISVIAKTSGTVFGQSVTSNTISTLSSFSNLAFPGGLVFDTAGALYASDLGSVAKLAQSATLVQGGSTSATVANTEGYAGNLTITNAVGTVSYTESSSTYSSVIVVSSAGVITYHGSALSAGTYSVSGSESDSNAPSGIGTWTFTLIVAAPVARPTPPVAPAPSTASIPVSTFGPPTSMTTLSTTPTTESSTSGGATESLTAPAGALPIGTVVSIYPVINTGPLVTAVPIGSTYVTSFAVTWQAPNGTTPNASAPFTAVVTDANIAAGDTIYELTPTGLVTMGAAATAGSISVTFSNDPIFLVTHETLIAQSTLHVTSLSGTVGTALRLATSGGSGSGLVSFAVADGTATGCRIIADTLTAADAGTCIVIATRASDNTYLATSSAPTAVTLTPKLARLHVTRVHGYAIVGSTVTLTIAGAGFYGQPSVTSDDIGARAIVSHDTGTLLTLRVTARVGTRKGWHTFTIRLAKGPMCKVNYSTR